MPIGHTDVTAPAADAMPTITRPHVHCGLEPEYAIQYYSRDASDWRFWDCAYTHVEADNLLASYNRRYRAAGHEWRLAKIVYASA